MLNGFGMERHWCMCETVTNVYRDGFSTCAQCGGKDAYKMSLDRPENMQFHSEYQCDPPVKEPCMHDNCSECGGSGRRSDGNSCIHMISCPCPKCSPRC